ncbi:peptidylprolyl isomerase [Glacieibacterium sp.]|uniref:peptidylprolyl isomerase n=1 Tax=Glacieibacterium sp. TaxID=2860237 RepID=UPI003AFF71D8
MRGMMAAAAAFGLSMAMAVPAQAQKEPEVATTPKELPKSEPTVVKPPPPVTPENTLLLDLSTGGRVTIVMRPDIAPNSVERIKTLTRQHFYDGTVFHRVIDGFMAQGGDPTGTGTGGSKLPDLKAEFNDLPHLRGSVAMARATSPDSANSQFYIVLQPVMKLDHNYTVWGRVVGGMEFVDAIEKGEPPANPSKIVQASIAADNIAPPAPSSPVPAAGPAPMAFPSQSAVPPK